MKYLKTFNENNNNMSREIKELSTEEINNFNETELGQFIVSYGDGQGDTYLETLGEMVLGQTGQTYTEILDSVLDDISGNMMNLVWIENNKLMDIVFTD